MSYWSNVGCKGMGPARTLPITGVLESTGCRSWRFLAPALTLPITGVLLLIIIILTATNMHSDCIYSSPYFVFLPENLPIQRKDLICCSDFSVRRQPCSQDQDGYVASATHSSMSHPAAFLSLYRWLNLNYRGLWRICLVPLAIFRCDVRPRSHYGKNAASASESWAFPWQLTQRGKFERQTLLRLTWGNRLRCRWWEWRLAEKQCLSSKISFKTFVFAWVEQLFDIRLFKVCFVPSFCSRWARGSTTVRGRGSSAPNLAEERGVFWEENDVEKGPVVWVGHRPTGACWLVSVVLSSRAPKRTTSMTKSGETQLRCGLFLPDQWHYNWKWLQIGKETTTIVHAWTYM